MKDEDYNGTQCEYDQMTSEENWLSKRLHRQSIHNQQTKMSDDVEGQVSMANARRYILYKQLRIV